MVSVHPRIKLNFFWDVKLQSSTNIICPQNMQNKLLKNKELPPMVTKIASYNLTQVDAPAGAYEMITDIAGYN